MEMVLNRLPAKTWNRLRMNEAVAAVGEEGFEIVKPIVKLEHTGLYWEENTKNALPKMQTGMGSDLDEVIAGVNGDLLQAEEKEQEKEACLTYTYTGEKKEAALLRLHAKEKSSLSVIVTLQNGVGSHTPGSVLQSVEEQRKEKVLENTGAAGKASTEADAVFRTLLYAEKDAKIKLYLVQLFGDDTTALVDLGGICEENAQIELIRIDLGAKKLYTGAAVDLKGSASSFRAGIGYHVRTGQMMDMNYVVNHLGKKTQSLMEASAVLEDHADKLFRGTIDFQRGCAGAKGTETETVLLLGDGQVNQTIPLILCQEEDVEGNHGASIGKLDEKMLFYLSTRGISQEEAQKMIARSRIDALCEKIPEEAARNGVWSFEGYETEGEEEKPEYRIS